MNLPIETWKVKIKAKHTDQPLDLMQQTAQTFAPH